MSKNVIGARIRSLRGRGNPRVTQEELVARLQALGLDMDQPALSRIERGERLITDVEILGICDALWVGVTELFKGARLPGQR